jgi:hypothetical protein
VSVPKGGDKGYSIPVRVDTIGGKPVSGQFDVVDYEDDGTWKLAHGTVDIYLGGSFRGLNATVNGVPVDGDHRVPGDRHGRDRQPQLHTVGNDDPHRGRPERLLAAVRHHRRAQRRRTSLFQTAVRSAVDTCIASKNLAAGCGIDIPDA